ncbi:hypothetical protein BDW68DRAFT_152343 [Aspergillus falconensis]
MPQDITTKDPPCPAVSTFCTPNRQISALHPLTHPREAMPITSQIKVPLAACPETVRLRPLMRRAKIPPRPRKRTRCIHRIKQTRIALMGRPCVDTCYEPPLRRCQDIREMPLKRDNGQPVWLRSSTGQCCSRQREAQSGYLFLLLNRLLEPLSTGLAVC